MIGFMFALSALTVLFAGILLFIKKKVTTTHRGGFLIIMSGLYFSTLFIIAHFMRESFK